MCGLNCDSDHFLVKTVFKEKLITTPRTGTRDKKRWNPDNLIKDIRKDGTLDNLINQDKRRQYRSNLHRNLSNVKVEGDTERMGKYQKIYLRSRYRNQWIPAKISKK
jgi:hypothetical protein